MEIYLNSQKKKVEIEVTMVIWRVHKKTFKWRSALVPTPQNLYFQPMRSTKYVPFLILE